eukprot:11000898-Alexandrium_andersonii.AAC.1
MQSPAAPTAAMGTLARTPPPMMASSSLVLGSLRGPPWPPSGQRALHVQRALGACAVGLNC